MAVIARGVLDTRKINNKALDADITLTPTDIGAVSLTGDQTISGNKTFTGNVSLGTGLATYDTAPVASNQIANKNYVDFAIGQALGTVDTTNLVTTNTGQTITGAKTFSANLSVSGAAVNFATATSVSVPTPSVRTNAANKGYVDDAIAAMDMSGFVTLTDSQTITGSKVFSGGITGSLTGNASTATTLATARTINGTSFNGSANITTANWGTARNITIGNTTKSVNGSANVAWTAAEIGVSSEYPKIRKPSDIFATIDGVSRDLYDSTMYSFVVEYEHYYDATLRFYVDDTSASEVLTIKVPHNAVPRATGQYGSLWFSSMQCFYSSSTGGDRNLTLTKSSTSVNYVYIRLIVPKYGVSYFDGEPIPTDYEEPQI